MDKQFENESKMCKRGFPVSRNVYMRTRVKFMCVNKYASKLKLNEVQLLRLRVILHTLRLIFIYTSKICM